MHHLQNVKYVAVTAPATVDDAALTTATIDTAGADYLTIIVQIAGIDIAMTGVKVQESDASNMANPADITGTVLGTAKTIDGTTSALPTADSDNTLHVFQIDLRGRKRYIDLVGTVGDGSTGAAVAAIAILSRLEQAPTTSAAAGATQILRC